MTCNSLFLHMISQYPKEHFLECKDSLFMEWVQRSPLEDTSTEVLLDVLAKRKVFVNDFPVEIGHSFMCFWVGMGGIESVDIVFLSGRGRRGWDTAHQMHETCAWIGRKMPYREDMSGRSSSKPGGVESG